MLTVCYLYKSGREECITIAATDWKLLETMEKSAMLSDFGVIGVEIVKYEPLG